jgi:molybdenum cofactor cytidylyltransferase
MDNDNKLLLPIEGVAIIQHVCKTVLSANINPVIVVTGYENEIVSQAIPKEVDNIVYNSDWNSGMSSSIYKGISSLPENVDGNMIVLGDMPMISTDTLQLLIDQFIKQKGRLIIYPIYEDRQANPVIFPKKYFSEILSSTGDRGCKKVLKQYPEDAIGIPIQSQEVVLDCDTKDDYFNLLAIKSDYVQA